MTTYPQELFPRPCVSGIYLLRLSGKSPQFYIGESEDVIRRFDSHWSNFGRRSYCRRWRDGVTALPLRIFLLREIPFVADWKKERLTHEQRFIGAAVQLRWSLVNKEVVHKVDDYRAMTGLEEEKTILCGAYELPKTPGREPTEQELAYSVERAAVRERKKQLKIEQEHARLAASLAKENARRAAALLK